MTNDAPQWLKVVVRDAHRGNTPDDWVYEECRAAYEAYQHEEHGSRADWQDWELEYSDSRVEIYTRQLFQWAADECLTELYREAEAEATELLGPEASTEDRFKAIQLCAIRFIATTIFRACEEHQ